MVTDQLQLINLITKKLKQFNLKYNLSKKNNNQN